MNIADVAAAIPVPRNYQLADAFYEALVESIEDFQSELKPNQQVLAMYTTPDGERVTVHNIGYQNPNLMIFSGEDAEQQSCTVLVHINSAHLILKAVIVKQSDEPKRIGFRGQTESA